MSNFQIILTGIFVFFIFLGVILFAKLGGNNYSGIGNVVIWGTFDSKGMDIVLSELVNIDDSFGSVKYVQKNADTFDEDLAEALASGKGPDLFIFPQESILKHKDKTIQIPYDSYTERDFKDKFIEEGELFLDDSGIYAFPLIIDPMVMYWNRDIFSKNGYSLPPDEWDQFFSLSKNITEKDDELNVYTSLVSFGEYSNVQHAKEILSFLIMQTGNPIIQRDGSGYNVTLSNKLGSDIVRSAEALDFYTQFSNPTNSVYTWNKSLPNSRNSFLAGDLALYFGYASEISELRERNPNLNFDVASIPQTLDGKVVTFGKMYAIGIARNSGNTSGSFKTIKGITSSEVLRSMEEIFNLPPVDRNLLNERPSSSYMDVFYKSALVAKGWLDPNPSQTNSIFEEMVDSVVSGRSRVSEAINRANLKFDDLFN